MPITYPFVTSSNTITAGACTGLGIAPSKIGEVIGITKAYCTRVGSGPFPSELLGETGDFLRKEGQEFGATTGRPRRCGWIDLPQLRYTCMLNGVTQLVVTKMDILDNFEQIGTATHYVQAGEASETLPYDICADDLTTKTQLLEGWKQSLDNVTTFEGLPEAAQNYIAVIEKYLDTPVSMVSTGPERHKLILKNV